MQLIDYVGVSGAATTGFADPFGRSNQCASGVNGFCGNFCRNGMLTVETRKMKDCTDGTTSTIIVAEQSGQVNGVEISAQRHGSWEGLINGKSTEINMSTLAAFLHPGETTGTSAASRPSCGSPTGTGRLEPPGPTTTPAATTR